MRSARRDSPSLRLMGLVGFRRGRGPEQIYDATGQWTRQPIVDARTYCHCLGPGFQCTSREPPNRRCTACRQFVSLESPHSVLCAVFGPEML